MATTLTYLEGSTHDRHKLDLFLPIEKKSNILFVYIHGGAWVARSKDNYTHIGELFKASGYTTAVIGYRLSTPQDPNGLKHPEHTNDCISALDWLYDHREEYGYSHCCVMGHSAGGFMDTLLSVDLQHFGKTKFQQHHALSVVSIEGIHDIPLMVEERPNYIGWVVEPAFATDPESMASVSPTHVVRATNYEGVKMPRYLVIHSKDDELVNYNQTTQLVEAMVAKGISAQQLLVEGLTHFDIVNTIEGFKTIMPEIVAFALQLE